MILVYALVGAHSACLLLVCCRVQTITAEQERDQCWQETTCEEAMWAVGRGIVIWLKIDI